MKVNIVDQWKSGIPNRDSLTNILSPHNLGKQLKMISIIIILIIYSTQLFMVPFPKTQERTDTQRL